MANSIGSTIFKILADNEPFKKGLKEAENVKKKVSDAIAKYDKKEADLLAKINVAIDKRVAKEQELDKVIKSGGSAEAIAKVRAELARLNQAEEKIEKQIAKNNKARRDSYKKLSEDIEKVGSKAKATADTLRKYTSGMIGSFVGVSALKATVDKLDALGKRANDIGLTASQLQEFEHQAKLSGISTGDLDSAVKAFNRNLSLATMGTGEAKTALEGMGISLNHSNGATKTQSELLKESAKYFADNAGAAQNAGYAARIFGESGVELLRIFESGEDNINAIFNAQGIDEAAAAAARFNDALENVQNVGLKVGSKIVEGLSYVADFFTNDLFNGIGDAAYKRAQDKLNAETAKKIKQQQEAAKQIAALNQKQTEADVEAIKNIQALQKKLADSRLTDAEKLAQEKQELLQLNQKLSEYDELSKEYADIYKEIVDKTIAKESLEAKILKEQNAEREKALKEEEKLAFAVLETAKKEEEAAAKKQQEQAKSYQEFLKEHELAKNIARAKYNGNEELAKQIKQQAEAAKLADKYNISLREANKILNEQKKIKDIESGKTAKYTDEEKAKAKKVLERGEKGTVGKKTLEDAQAVLDGKEIKNKTAMFKDFGKDKDNKKLNQNRQQEPKAKEEQQQVKEQIKLQEEANETQQTMVDTMNNIYTSLTEILNTVNVLATEAKK